MPPWIRFWQVAGKGIVSLTAKQRKRRPVGRDSSFEEIAAARLTLPRPQVELPVLEYPMPLLEERDPVADAATRKAWWNEVQSRIQIQVLALAEVVGADPAELAKAAPWLVELIPPRKKVGRPTTSLDGQLRILARVAEKYRGSIKTACELAVVDPKKFRDCRKAHPWAWRMFLDAVRLRRSQSRI